MIKILRYILLPIVPIYHVITWLRNKLYDLGIKKSLAYDFPLICVGNLSVGGTGKTPMIEYLIRLLNTNFRIATLSRGYKRSTDGFVIADESVTAFSIGDEPFQFYKKFGNIIVSVDADRRNGISELMKLNNSPQLILLDDAFQHRKVKATLNILLTSYSNLYVNDFSLPTGNLREPKSGAKRADIIVVTKSPESISETEKQGILKSLELEQHQKAFFSWISYSNVIKNPIENKELEELKSLKFTLVTGIANPYPLLTYLKSKNLNFEHLNFKDHHIFTLKEIANFKTKEFILTTEKDYMRLVHSFKESEKLFYLPIELKIDRPEEFELLIKEKITQTV